MKIKLVTDNFEQHVKIIKSVKKGQVICSIVLNEKEKKRKKRGKMDTAEESLALSSLLPHFSNLNILIRYP